MRPYVKHRYAIALPFLVLAIATLAGGAFNSVEARGRVVDGTTGAPLPGIEVTYGTRIVKADADGNYVVNNLPRGARVSAQIGGYGKGSAGPDDAEIRLQPVSLTLQVNDAETKQGVKGPEVRFPGSQSVKGTDTGSIAVIPYPPTDTPILVCAEGYDTATYPARGVTGAVELKKGSAGCPPLPTPSPPTAPSPSGSPAAPSATPSPSGP
ncbi:MAG: hypothetical protein ABR525_08395 [Candidatus Limnocylindria bacterium]